MTVKEEWKRKVNLSSSWIANNEQGWKGVSHSGSDIFNMPEFRVIDDIDPLIASIETDFTFSADFKVRGEKFADAAGFFLRSQKTWLKLCIERDNKQAWRIMSIYSNPYSDECNGEPLTSSNARLLVTREGRRIALWFSPIGSEEATFIRTCTWPSKEPLDIGFFVQSPFSEGSQVEVENIKIEAISLKDKR